MDDVNQQNQLRSSTVAASGFDPEDLCATQSGASNFVWLFDAALIIWVMFCMVRYAQRPVAEHRVTVTCIRWVDITGYTGWTSGEDIEGVSPVTSCGILVKEDDDVLYLAMDKADGKGEVYNSTGAFPQGVIKARHDVVISLQ